MKIAVVGATGPTGQHVVEELLRRGHEVVAYVRRPEGLHPRTSLEIVGGQLSDTRTFAHAIQNCEVVICTLGNRNFKERRFMTQHLPYVSSAMKSAGVNKLVLMSALGGGEVPRAARGISKLVFRFLSSKVFVDRTISERELNQTGILWTGVYPGFLNDKPSIGVTEVVDLDKVVDSRNTNIPRVDVATTLVDCAENFQSQRLAIAKPGAIKLAK